MTKKIWIDITEFKNWKGHLTGIQRVVAMLASGIKEELGDGVGYIYYDDYLNKFILIEDIEITPQGISEDALKNYRPITYRMNIFMRALRKFVIVFIDKPIVPSFNAGDVIFIPGSNLAYKDYTGALEKVKQDYSVKISHVIHDALPLSVSHFFAEDLVEKYDLYFSKIIELADDIVSVSQATEEDVKDTMGTLVRKYKPAMSVIPSGSSIEVSSSVQPKNFPFKKRQYLISWGTVEPRKNRELLYNTYKYASREGIELPPLVIAGKVGWLSNDLLAMLTRDKELEGKVLFIDSPRDEELTWLIKNSKFSVYPSHAEGWGLPVAESLYYGKTCITTSLSSLPEVAGDIVEYINNPYDPHEMKDKILELSKPSNLKAAEAKIKNFKPIEWKDCIAQYTEHLKKV